MKISLILVCYFSSGYLEECLKTFRREARRCGVETEIILVDHSGDPAEIRAMEALAPDCLLYLPNRGYAAGLNAGAARATGEVLFLANPDILFLGASIGKLLDALKETHGVFGPQLFWDREGEILLPPPEDPRPFKEGVRILRRAGRMCWWWGLQRELDRVHRIWSATSPIVVETLRGPLLVLRKSDWDRLGQMDEGYFLYYEETEWLLRARKCGLRSFLVPGARLVHQWGHATRGNPESEELERRSRERFYKRNFPAFSTVLNRLERLGTRSPWRGAVEGELSAMHDLDADFFLFSPFEHLMPAVGWMRRNAWPNAASELFVGNAWLGAAFSRDGDRWQLRGPYRFGDSV